LDSRSDSAIWAGHDAGMALAVPLRSPSARSDHEEIAMNRHSLPRSSFLALLIAALAACGGGSTGAAIGGNLSGLASGNTVVLQDNATDNLTLSANGSFTFTTKLGSTTPYAVTVLTQPSGQTCTVEGGSGSTDSSADSIHTVSVTCTTTATVSGTVSGLTSGTAVTLSNGAVLLPVAANGTFSFPGLVEAGSAYDITVATQPAGETCVVQNGVGTVTVGTAVNVTVTCTAS
jgi:hypothetical protein